jgi:5,10-methylenetetrahydromethanopterin reductase
MPRSASPGLRALSPVKGGEPSILKVDIRVPVGAPIPRVAEFIARCEESGFFGVGVHDHPHSGRDAYIALALAAERTQRLQLYPATSSPAVRHPVLLASLAHSLDEIAPQRIALTVAPGFLSVRSVGKPRAGLAAMRDAIIQLRRLLAGERVLEGGAEFAIRNVSSLPTPVYLLAAGPKMVELAGEVADGAFLFVGLDPEAIARARAHLEIGAARAGRSLSQFETVFIVTIALDERLEEAIRWPRSWFAPGQPWLCYPSTSNLYWLREAGFDLDTDMRPEVLTEEQSSKIADAFGLFGPPERCLERLRQARDESGVEHVFLFPAHTLESGYNLPVREVEAFARVIGPRL